MTLLVQEKWLNMLLEWLKAEGETFDFACTIYATAPLLQPKYLIEGYNALKNSTAINAFSATSMPFPIQRTFKVNDEGRCEMFTPEHYMTRSQDLEEAYQDAGQFYWTKQIKHLMRSCLEKTVFLSYYLDT